MGSVRFSSVIDAQLLPPGHGGNPSGHTDPPWDVSPMDGPGPPANTRTQTHLIDKEVQESREAMAAARTLNLMGNRASIKATAEETDGAFGMIEFVATPGAPPPSLHVHSREDEFLYVLEGRLVVTVAHEERFVEAGGFVFMPRGEIGRA